MSRTMAIIPLRTGLKIFFYIYGAFNKHRSYNFNVYAFLCANYTYEIYTRYTRNLFYADD